MLGLHYPTPPEWASRALQQPSALLLDHYFCETKAAAMARRVLKLHGLRYPVLRKLMPELAAEELEHAGRVEQLLKEFPRIRALKGGNPYAQGLRQLAHSSGHGSLLDRLLICSLIEARSAERFRLLADACGGTPLGHFYEDLYASEVNHHVLFTHLAAEFFGEAEAQGRLEMLRAGEARLIRSLPPGPCVHSGPG